MTAIEWTDQTWNPVTGCDRVSPGCAHCYALDLAARLKAMGQGRYQRDGDPRTSGPGFGVTLHEDRLEEPLRWRKPRMVFVNSMSDLFHPVDDPMRIEQPGPRQPVQLRHDDPGVSAFLHPGQRALEDRPVDLAAGHIELGVGVKRTTPLTPPDRPTKE